MRIHILLAGFISLMLLEHGYSADSGRDSFSTLILGKWLGPTKYEIYYPDGTWGVQRNEDAPIDKQGRHWMISGNKLTLMFPGSSGISSVTQTIYILNHTQFITRDDGHSRVRERESHQKAEQGAAANP